MSKFGSTFSVRKGSREQNTTAQINMAPMIDFLVITIAYFLISASFCSVGLIDSSFQETQSAGAGAGGGSAAETHEIEVTLRANHTLSVKRGTASQELSSQDLLKLLEETGATQSVNQVSLNAEAGINFEEIIRLFNQVRQIIPQVTLNVDSI